MPDITRFTDRTEAGKMLASLLGAYNHANNVIVLALPRGGAPVALAVAQALGVPLDFLQVRKLGVPGHPEYAMGAIAADGTCTLRRDIIDELGISEQAVAMVAERESDTIRRREPRYRAVCPALSLRGHVIILVDDGMATGSTMHAAVRIVRGQHPARIVVAVPVGAAQACQILRPEVDELICPLTPGTFRAVGDWYDSFEQIEDSDVVTLLAAAQQRPAAFAPAPETGHTPRNASARRS